MSLTIRSTRATNSNVLFGLVNRGPVDDLEITFEDRLRSNNRGLPIGCL